MKTATYLLAVATFLAAPSLSATQSAIVSGIQVSAGELSPEVQLYVGLGDDLAGRLRYDAAAREYARAADLARHEGHLASGTMWMLATAHYYNGNLLGAAAALDQLTDEAARVGDLEVEALRSEEHTSELQSPCNLVCRLLLEKKQALNSSPRVRTITAPGRSRKQVCACDV